MMTYWHCCSHLERNYVIFVVHETQKMNAKWQVMSVELWVHIIYL
jgi:hypothetical protein